MYPEEKDLLIGAIIGLILAILLILFGGTLISYLPENLQ